MNMHTKQEPGTSGQNSSETATNGERAKATKSVCTAADAQRIPAWAATVYGDGLPPGLMLQTQLSMSQPGETYEQEADRISEQVMRMPEPGLQRTCTCGGACPKCQTEEEGREQERLQTKRIGSSDAGRTAAPPIVHEVLRSPGQPLDPATRAFMEPRFGHDFSQVRVHSGAAAEQSTREVNAHAYTVGHDMVFGAGQFAPGMHEGQRLLAHELTHVVQQSGRSLLRAGRNDDHGGVRSGEILARQPATAHGKSGVDLNIELARTLAKKLHDGKRDEVLHTIEGLASADRDALDVAATQALALDKPQGDELRRVIRFVRHKPASVRGEVFTVVGEGTPEPKAEANVAGGRVELHTGASIESGAGNSKEAFSLTYSDANATDMRWLQFVWREVVPEFPAEAKGAKPRREPFKKRLSHSGREFDLTTNPAKPSWNTDSGTQRSPFYEENTTVKRNSDKLAMFDFPSSMDDEAFALFNTAVNPPTRVVSHFHAATYLIHNMDVLYRADIDLTWEFTTAWFQSRKRDRTTPPPPVKATAKGGPAKQLESVQRARLVFQNPDVDYLPGPAPDPLGEFDVIQDLSPGGSLTENQWADRTRTTDVQRYADIVAIAHAEWINHVSGMPSNKITIVTDLKADVKPGLNYWPKLSVDEPGETGYIDAKGMYHNPDLPIDPDDPLPSIAIILGPGAFGRDKAWALQTLRHEMRHASHEQLTIGWLLKWHEERTGKPFKAWLEAERKRKQISAADFALVSSFLKVAATREDLAPTEVFAYTEGIITALPFLPSQPDLQLIGDDKYPAAIRALWRARPFFDAGSSEPVRESALQRVHDFCCEVLVQDQRQALVYWINFLLDPTSLKPKSETDKQTLKLVSNDFKPHKSFLNKVLASVQKPCK